MNKADFLELASHLDALEKMISVLAHQAADTRTRIESLMAQNQPSTESQKPEANQ